MKIYANYFIFPKKGCLPSECEDGLSINLRNGRFCVSDGASEAFDSRHWARLLAATWKLGVEDTLLDADALFSEILSLSKKWKRKWSGDNLPWYVEQKSAKGAFASFLGVQIKDETNDSVKWEVIGMGDCCLFIVDDSNRVTHSFPILSKEQFNNFPTLISTNFVDDVYFNENIKKDSGFLCRTEKMILMSDAMSNWFFEIADNDNKKSSFIASIKNRDKSSLRELIQAERESNLLRNDDIAIINIGFNN